MTNPRPPAGPSTPTPPPGPKTDLTWLERHRLTARWDAAEEEQRATDSLREHARLGLPVEVEMARLKTARQAWDAAPGCFVNAADRLLTRAEVAATFRVSPATVTRWAREGRIGSVRTLGGHRRYRKTDVQALLAVEELSPERTS